MRKIFLIGLTVLTLLFSCSKEDEIKKVFKASDLVTPADKSKVADNSIILEWKKNEDTSTKYDVFLATKAEFTDADKIKSSITETKCTVEKLLASSTYFWKVKSTNVVGEVLDSKVFSFTTGLKASGLKSPADKVMINEKSVSLEWEKNADVNAKYDVFLGTNDELTDADKIATKITDLTFLAKDLLSSSTYFWKVRTFDSEGVMLESSVFSFKTAMKSSPLLLPVDKAVIIENTVSLSWAKNANPDVKYDVFLANKADFSDVKKIADAISEVNFTVDKLVGGETYFWKVNTINKAGEIFESSIFSFSTIFGASTLVAPANNAIIKTNSIKLEWTKNVDFTSKYDVFLGTKAELTDEDKVATEISDIFYLAENIKAGTTYYWKVNTINGKGKILETSSFSFSNGLPTTPVLSFPKNKAELVKLTTNLLWSKSTLFDDSEVVYNIFYATTADFETNVIKSADLTTTKFSLTGLNEATSYSWKVVARNSNGDTAESEVFTFTTHETPITTLLLPANGSTGPLPDLIKWEEKEGFTYNVYLSKGSSSFTEANMVRRHAILGKYTPTNIEAGATYYWRIHALNAVGTEFPSETFSFTTEEEKLTIIAGEFTDRDGHVYKTTIINGVEWLAQNYAFVPDMEAAWSIPNVAKSIFKDGTKILNPLYSDVKNNPNYLKYGLLYTVEAATTVVPAGWHIATDAEWNDLEVALGMSKVDREINSYRGSHSPALKSVDGSWTTTATNTSKMNLLPAGRIWYGSVADFDKKAWVWTSTKQGTKFIYRSVYNNEAYLGVKRSSESISNQMSVRLVKDSE